MNKKWYRRIMIVFSIFMIALLLLQLLAGLLRPASRTSQPRPTPVSALTAPDTLTRTSRTQAVSSEAKMADGLPASHDPLAMLDNLLRAALPPWRPAHIGPG